MKYVEKLFFPAKSVNIIRNAFAFTLMRHILVKSTYEKEGVRKEIAPLVQSHLEMQFIGNFYHLLSIWDIVYERRSKRECPRMR